VGNNWVHRLISKDLAAGTGICTECGPIELGYRTMRGKQVVRCPVALRNRDSPNRYRPQPDRDRIYPHGLTASEARALKEGKDCALCGSDRKLVVDHCHSTNVIRGVLCTRCNVALGMFGDSPERLREAAEYLEYSRLAAAAA
jgi:hypothetical protein